MVVVDGVTVSEFPVPNKLPPQEPVYHFATYPSGATGLQEIVEFTPWHMEAGSALADTGALIEVLTVIPSVEELLDPQLLFAVTLIVPLTEPALRVIELETELPAQPGGKVHV